MDRIETKLAVSTVIAVLALCLLVPSVSHSSGDYYAGKTVVLVAATAAGGTADLRIRSMAPFFKKYLPGHPTVVVEYISGGGGRKAANHLYNKVRPDGLTIGAMAGGVVGLAIMGEMGIQYDPDKFIYLGSPQHINHEVLYTRADLGLDTLQKLRAKPGIRIGGQQIGQTAYTAGRLLAYFLDMKDPNFVVGYSGPELDIALKRGELDGRANTPISALRRNPEWLDKGLMHWHAIIESPLGKKFPRLEHLPEIVTFARNNQEKRLVQLWRSMRGVGSPYVLPPGTPKEVVAMVRTAVGKIFADPEFPAYYEKLTDQPASPLSADELTKIVADIPRDEGTLNLLKKFAGAGPLPRR